jgi:rhamnulokinase
MGKIALMGKWAIAPTPPRRSQLVHVILCRDVNSAIWTEREREAQPKKENKTMDEQHYLAVDLGAESGRVMSARISPGGITLVEQHRFANEPVKAGPTLHWDILSLWRGIKTGIAKAVREGGAIHGIGVDTWGVDFGLIDQNGELISNPVHYRDPRTNGMVENFFQRLPRSRVYSATGIQTMQINTLFQLAYLSEHRPETLKIARHLLYIPDLINYWLCGKVSNEYTIASTSQMLNARTRQYDSSILNAIPLPFSLMPPITPPGTVIGALLPEAVDGISPGNVPVIAVGSHDTASAVAGVPATDHDWLFISSGTWSLLGAEIDEPILSPEAAELNLTNEGGVGGKIRLIKNILGMWLLQECRRAWAADGYSYDYSELVNMAADAPAHMACINPDYPSFGQPGGMPQKIADYCRKTGQPVPNSPGQIARVILESLASTYARVAAMITRVTGKQYGRIHIVGGGSQNDLLNAFTADATGMRVLAGPVEATAIGNVTTQAIAVGQLQSISQARRLIAQTSQMREFTPHNRDIWQAMAEKHKHLFANQAKE